MSSFRLIFIAALTGAMIGLVGGSAAAQSATGQSVYLAGLRPPHEPHKPAHLKTIRLGGEHKPAIKSPRLATTRQPAVTAKSKTHRPVRLADKINSRVTWPSVEPTAADESATGTVLQFATEDGTSAPAASASATSAPAISAPATAPRPTAPAPVASATKTAPPANIAATAARDDVDPITADKAQNAPTIAQNERLEAPPLPQMRVIAPALGEAGVAASTASDQPPVRGRSSTPQIVVTLAGAITACVVAFVIFGFGSSRIRRI